MSPTPHLPRRRRLQVGGAALATTASTPALFGTAYRAPRTDGTDSLRGNLRKAQALLHEAGWTVQGGVLRNAQGQALELEYLDSNESGARVVTHASVFRRLEGVLEHADALIALPGGLTSLAALLQVWSFGDTLDGPYRPMVLVGEAWPPIVKALADAASLDRRTRAMVTFANTADEAVETLRYYVSARS